MAGSYGSLVHLPTELVRSVRGRPALFARSLPPKSTRRAKVLPVTMNLPLTVGCGHTLSSC